MKIFNIQPIIVTGYTLNQEYLGKTFTEESYESGFGFSAKVVDDMNTLFITFDILYSVGHQTGKQTVHPSDSPNKFTVEVEFEVGSNETFISYESTCQFNFESEGLEEDVQSITEFLVEYQAHTKTFLKQYAIEQVVKKEQAMRVRHTLKADALVAIDCLRANNMYVF